MGRAGGRGDAVRDCVEAVAESGDAVGRPRLARQAAVRDHDHIATVGCRAAPRGAGGFWRDVRRWQARGHGTVGDCGGVGGKDGRHGGGRQGRGGGVVW